ncbi:hypothetical protein GQ53DRAFT_715047 [Thozetella sp. PMI_491]|nr:hypothetical protein GQ53DRAFT_715047 [Thozetella sp. PMI_491]
MSTSTTTTRQSLQDSLSVLRHSSHAIRKRLFRFKETNATYLDCFGDEAYTTESKTYGKIILWRITGHLDYFASKIRGTVAKLINEERAYWQSRRPKTDASPFQEPVYLIQCYLIGVSQSHASPYVTIVSSVEWFSICLKDIILKSKILATYSDWGCFRLPIEPQMITMTPQTAMLANPSAVDISGFEIYVPGDRLPTHISGTDIEIWQDGQYTGRATAGGMVTVGGEDLALTVAHAFYPRQDPNPVAFEIDDSELNLLQSDDEFDEFGESNGNVYTPEVWPDTYMQRELRTDASPTSPTSPRCSSDFLLTPRSLIEGKTLLGRLKFLSNLWDDAVEEPGPLDWALVTITAPMTSRKNKPKPGASTNTSKIAIHTPFASVEASLLSDAIFGIPLCARPQPVVVARNNTVQKGDSGSWMMRSPACDPVGMLIGHCFPLSESYFLRMHDVLRDIVRQTGLQASVASFDQPTSQESTNFVREEQQGIHHHDPSSPNMQALDAEGFSEFTRLNGVANVLEREGRLKEAEGARREILSLATNFLGSYHPDTVDSMSRLAMLLDKQGNYGEAEALYRQALGLRTNLLGIEHSDTLASMNNVAVVLCKQERRDEAEAIYQQTRSAAEKVFGNEHFSTLASINNLAIVLSKQGEHKEAAGLHRQAVDLATKLLGSEHPDTLTSKNNLGNVLHLLGSFREAESIHRQMLDLRTQVLGAEHPDTLASMHNLGLAFDSQGRNDAAKAMYQKALGLKTKVLGAEHPSTLNTQKALDILLGRQSDYPWESESAHSVTKQWESKNGKRPVTSPPKSAVLHDLEKAPMNWDRQGNDNTYHGEDRMALDPL